MKSAVLRRFSFLLGAHAWREILLGIFLLALARRNPAGYGEMMLAFQFGAILLFLAEAGLNPHLVVRIANAPDRFRAWLRHYAWVRAGLLSILCGGAWIFARSQGYSPRLQALVLLLGGAIGLDALGGTFFVGLQVAGKQAAESRIRGWAAALGWGYGLAALAAGAGVFRLLVAKWIETLVNLVGAARTAWTAAPPEAATSAETPGPGLDWRESLPFTAMAVAAILCNKANVFFLQRWGGIEAVAQYSATWQLVDGLCVLVSSLLLGRVLYPLFVRQWRADRGELERLVQQAARWLSLAAGMAVLALGLGSEPLIRLLYGSAYGEAARVQPLLAWSIPFALLHNTAAYLLLAAGRRWFLVWAYGAALALNLALCRFGMPSHPLSGAAWAIVATKGCLAAVTVAAACRLVPFWRSATAAQLMLAVLAGWAIFRAATPLLGAAALLPAWLPAGWLGWRWWREHVRRVPPDNPLPASGSSG